MFISKKDMKKEIALSEELGRQKYIERLSSWHCRIDSLNKKLSDEFSIDNIKQVNVNFWDDFPSGGATYAYVETSAPDDFCFNVLVCIYSFLTKNSLVRELGVNIGMRYYDSSQFYPELIGKDDTEYRMFKRWEITIENSSYEDLDLIIEEMKNFGDFKSKPLIVYSKS